MGRCTGCACRGLPTASSRTMERSDLRMASLLLAVRRSLALEVAKPGILRLETLVLIYHVQGQLLDFPEEHGVDFHEIHSVGLDLPCGRHFRKMTVRPDVVVNHRANGADIPVRTRCRTSRRC